MVRTLRSLPVAALLATLTTVATGQRQRGPQLHVAFAAGAARGDTEALDWLCEEFLPTRPEWPQGLKPQDPFAITLTLDGLRIAPTDVRPPQGSVALGTGRLDDALHDTPPFIWCCDRSGRERWHVPRGFVLPERYRRLARAIDADVLDTPRTFAIAVAAGHLAGGFAEGDPRATALRLGAALCGDATWTAWSDDRGDVHVRGCSEGGLVMPLTLLLVAAIDGGDAPSGPALRAFAARDADRTEATRQLGRSDRDVDVVTLRALLHANDAVRLTAIDALVRLGLGEELPHIVAAADPEHPWATIAANDALRILWRDASSPARAATRRALEQSPSQALRGVDLDRLVTARDSQSSSTAGDLPPSNGRARLLFVLFCTALGLFGLWTRERLRTKTVTATA